MDKIIGLAIADQAITQGQLVVVFQNKRGDTFVRARRSGDPGIPWMQPSDSRSGEVRRADGDEPS